MKLELTLNEIIHLSHCAQKMSALAERSTVIADALDIDIIGRQKLQRITEKLSDQTQKYLRTEPATSNQQSQINA